MNITYYLSGFYNPFNIVPDFVIPIFRNEFDHSQFFIQYINNGMISFEEYTICQFRNMQYYDIENVSLSMRNLNPYKNIVKYCIKGNWRRFSYKDEQLNPLLSTCAFQTQDEIVYGEVCNLVDYVDNFSAKDKYLVDQIRDFKEFVKLLVLENKDKLLQSMSMFNSYDLQVINDSPIKVYSKQIQPYIPLGLEAYILNISKLDNVISKLEKCYNEIGNINLPAFYVCDLIRVFDEQLRKCSVESSKYKSLIKILYLLLYSEDLKEKDYSIILDGINLYYKRQNND